jgi:hypothetical protein
MDVSYWPAGLGIPAETLRRLVLTVGPLGTEVERPLKASWREMAVAG